MVPRILPETSALKAPAVKLNSPDTVSHDSATLSPMSAKWYLRVFLEPKGGGILSISSNLSNTASRSGEAFLSLTFLPRLFLFP